jgi:hypothetical protein
VASLGDDDPQETGSGSTPPTGTVDAQDVEARMLDFAQCMRDNGVDMEDPEVDADGNVTFGGFGGGPSGPPGTADDGGGGAAGPPDGVREAFEACGDLIEGIQLGGGRGGFDPTALQDQLVEFAQCMRDHGVQMDDPQLGGPPAGGSTDGSQPRPGPNGGGPFGDLDQDDPEVQAAMDACSDLLGDFGPGGRPGGGGPAGNGGAVPNTADQGDG